MKPTHDPAQWERVLRSPEGLALRAGGALIVAAGWSTEDGAGGAVYPRQMSAGFWQGMIERTLIPAARAALQCDPAAQEPFLRALFEVQPSIPFQMVQRPARLVYAADQGNTVLGMSLPPAGVRPYALALGALHREVVARMNIPNGQEVYRAYIERAIPAVFDFTTKHPSVVPERVVHDVEYKE